MSAKDDKFKKILEEVDLRDGESAETSQLLEELANSPDLYGRREPPAGYESQLIAALRTRLPLEEKKSAPIETRRSSVFQNFFGSKSFAWSFSGAMTVFVAVLAFQNLRRPTDSTPADFLTQTAQKGSSEAVERWVASVADIGVQMQDVHQGALVDELTKADPSVVDRALDSVEKSVGMPRGI